MHFHYCIIMRSYRALWTPLKLERQADDFCFSGINSCQKNVANALNSVGRAYTISATNHFGHKPYQPQSMTISATRYTISATTISATNHIGHKAWQYQPQDIRGGFCRTVLCLYPSCSGGSFRTFMTKIKRIKICWKARSWGRLKMRDIKV